MDLATLDLEPIGHRRLVETVWRMRESVRVADACYLACAELLGTTLLTTDAAWPGVVMASR